jgi:hypothetical protein
MTADNPFIPPPRRAGRVGLRSAEGEGEGPFDGSDVAGDSGAIAMGRRFGDASRLSLRPRIAGRGSGQIERTRFEKRRRILAVLSVDSGAKLQSKERRAWMGWRCLLWSRACVV